MIYSCDFETTNHNKDYSVVKTLGSLVLNGGFFFIFAFAKTIIQ